VQLLLLWHLHSHLYLSHQLLKHLLAARQLPRCPLLPHLRRCLSRLRQ
jgi:hypothetical protein